MSLFTAQEKKVLLFVFSCLFVGIIVSGYLKSHPQSKIFQLSPQEKTLMHKEPVDINTADFNQLNGIPGVGPSLAESILDYRKNNGLFKEVDDLLKVKGIGKKKLEKIKPLIILR